jgi:hypothetical protein
MIQPSLFQQHLRIHHLAVEVGPLFFGMPTGSVHFDHFGRHANVNAVDTTEANTPSRGVDRNTLL